MLPGKPILLCPQPPSFTAGDQGEVRQNPDSKPKFNYIWDEWNGLYATSIGADERNRIEKLLDEVILEIIAENSWVPKDRLIKDLNTNVLRISITTEERDFAKGNGGKYFPDRGLMALIYRPEPFGSKAYYKTYFLNELASHFIAVSNIVCKADEGTSAGIQTETPLGAKIADTLVRGFHVAIRRMRSIFYKQHDLGMSSLEPDEITSFIEFSYLIKNYLPFPLINPWPDSSVLNYIEEGVLQWGDEQTIVPGPNFQPSITSLSFHGKISGDRIIFHYCAGHFPLKHRMSEFFRRMEFITSNFRKDTPSPYYNLPPNIQFEELASFVLSEMPPALIDLFFEDLQADYQKYISRCEPDPIEKSQTNKATDTAKPSLLNVGFWITAGVGTLRKWWQGNAIKPVKSVRPVAQHATATNSATTFFLPTPAAAENPKNFQVNACRPFLRHDTEVLFCSTPGSEVMVYPKANTDGSALRYLPDTSHTHTNLSDSRTMLSGDTYFISSCRSIGDSAVYCEGRTTSLIYSPKQPYRSVANSSHIGASVCLLATTGKMFATLGHWAWDRVKGHRAAEDSAAEIGETELATQNHLLKLVKKFKRQYPQYRKHAYIQAFKQLQKLVLDPDEDIHIQLAEHFKKIVQGEFSKCKRQDKREKEGMAILRYLARLHVEPIGTKVFNLLPPEVQDYLDDYTSDAHQYLKKELGITISLVKPKLSMEDERIESSTDAEKRTYQRLTKLPPQIVVQLSQFGFAMQNTPAPRQLLASMVTPTLGRLLFS